MMSFGKNRVSFRPTGSRTSSLTARSYVDPVTFSMTRPARVSDALLYETMSPGGVSCWQLGHVLDVARQRVVAVAGVGEVVAGPARGVVEQLKDA